MIWSRRSRLEIPNIGERNRGGRDEGGCTAAPQRPGSRCEDESAEILSEDLLGADGDTWRKLVRDGTWDIGQNTGV